MLSLLLLESLSTPPSPFIFTILPMSGYNIWRIDYPGLFLLSHFLWIVELFYSKWLLKGPWFESLDIILLWRQDSVINQKNEFCLYLPRLISMVMFVTCRVHTLLRWRWLMEKVMNLLAFPSVFVLVLHHLLLIFRCLESLPHGPSTAISVSKVCTF